MPGPDIEEIIEEYILRLEAGLPYDEAKCLKDYPHLADELREFFRVHQQAKAAFEFDSAEEPRSPISNRVFPSTAEDDLRSDASMHSAWSWNQIAEAQFPLRFGHYDLVEEINRGGMGVVYRAVHRDLGRTVALKVLRAGELATEEEVRRFRTEVLASTSLNHPNIIPTFEAGEQHGLFYLTMAFIEGQDLQAMISKGSLSANDAAQLVLKITEAVRHAHAHNIIHRDIKPSNILIDGHGEPYLADFGLAHRMATEDGGTLTGQILGTPAYMPPEQASGRAKRLTTAVDVYSLGAVLYATITGQPPFSGPTPFDVLLQVVDRQPPAPRQVNRQCPRTLESICLKAMHKQVAERYATAADLANDLKRFLRREPIDFPRPTMATMLLTWWRREPILVSHLAALTAVIAIVVLAYRYGASTITPELFGVKVAMLIAWIFGCVGLQRCSRLHRWRHWIHLIWAGADVIIYTALMVLADSPRGLLLVGYPMMIAASGLFYRVRFVIFMTITCILAMLFLTSVVADPLNARIDFLAIYVMGLCILGLCVMTMIRRIRGLSRFCGASE